MQLPVAEDLLRNAEKFIIAFGNVINATSSENPKPVERNNISMYLNDHVVICILNSLVFNAQMMPSNPEMITDVVFAFKNTQITIPANAIRSIKGTHNIINLYAYSIAIMKVNYIIILAMYM